uniref:Thioredoxin domain-containing protein n=1 Tax=viral metagenome TaxID=1070528 RepID=A0A6C0HH21_9ZZZZ
MPGLPILDKIDNVKQFGEYLQTNPGLIIIKFGAEWCGPCKMIEKQVHDWFDRMPATVQGFIIDVDESFELYAFLKTKKMVNGVPVILCYDKGNLNYIPSDNIIGADKVGIDAFFNRCLAKVNA